MKRPAYREYASGLDVDAFEAAIGFEVLREGTNKAGEPEDIGQCPDPWHLHKNGDLTGKFAINRERKLYNCFVCGGGSLLDLAMAIQDLEEDEANEWLAEFARAVDETDEAFLSQIDALLAQHKHENPVLPYYNPHVLKKWTAQLPSLARWLHERGISDDVAVLAGLGYDGRATRMAPVSPSAGRGDPYQGPCVYFPHFWGERLVGWQQRWLEDDRPKWLQKYTNTTGFPKAETIYNYERIYFAERPVIVVESVPSALLLWSLGYPAVAMFGGSVTEEQMRLLRFCQQGICLAPDNDAPGRKWTSYSDDERKQMRRGRKVDRVILGDYLARYVPVKVMEAVGEYDSGNDVGDLLDEGPRFAAEAIRWLYEQAPYY